MLALKDKRSGFQKKFRISVLSWFIPYWPRDTQVEWPVHNLDGTFAYSLQSKSRQPDGRPCCSVSQHKTIIFIRLSMFTTALINTRGKV